MTATGTTNYRQATDPDARPAMVEIVVTQDGLAPLTYHTLEHPTQELVMTHPDLLAWCGGDLLDATHWTYRLKPATLAALTDDQAYAQIAETVLRPAIRRECRRELTDRPYIETGWYEYQLEQVG